MTRFLSFVTCCLFTFLLVSPTQAGINDGLVAHYLLDGDAQDASGNGNDAILNGPSPATDRFGVANGALYFDGQNDTVVLPLSSSDFGSAISISAWVYREKTIGCGPEMSVISNDTPSGSNRGVKMGYYNCPTREGARFDVFTGPTTKVEPIIVGVLPEATWTLMTLTYDGSVANFYINDTFVKSGPLTGVLPGTRMFEIGRDTYGTSISRYWGGKIVSVCGLPACNQLSG